MAVRDVQHYRVTGVIRRAGGNGSSDHNTRCGFTAGVCRHGVEWVASDGAVSSSATRSSTGAGAGLMRRSARELLRDSAVQLAAMDAEIRERQIRDEVAELKQGWAALASFAGGGG